MYSYSFITYQVQHCAQNGNNLVRSCNVGILTLYATNSEASCVIVWSLWISHPEKSDKQICCLYDHNTLNLHLTGMYHFLTNYFCLFYLQRYPEDTWPTTISFSKAWANPERTKRLKVQDIKIANKSLLQLWWVWNLPW